MFDRRCAPGRACPLRWGLVRDTVATQAGALTNLDRRPAPHLCKGESLIGRWRNQGQFKLTARAHPGGGGQTPYRTGIYN